MAKAKKAGRGAKGKAPRKEHWKGEPDEHDYPAATDYLSLLMTTTQAQSIVKSLEAAPLEHRKAKDLLRASSLPLLGADNFHVAKDLEKVQAGEKLSPVLLVRGQLNESAPLTIADGYHRVCASYHLDEDADIPCHIVDLRI
jgi:hypothetical protein